MVEGGGGKGWWRVGKDVKDEEGKWNDLFVLNFGVMCTLCAWGCSILPSEWQWEPKRMKQNNFGNKKWKKDLGLN